MAVSSGDVEGGLTGHRCENIRWRELLRAVGTKALRGYLTCRDLLRQHPLPACGVLCHTRRAAQVNSQAHVAPKAVLDRNADERRPRRRLHGKVDRWKLARYGE